MLLNVCVTYCWMSSRYSSGNLVNLERYPTFWIPILKIIFYTYLIWFRSQLMQSMQRWVKKAVLRVFLCNCISIWYVILCKIKQIHVTQHVFCTMDHIFYYIFVQGQKRLWFASLATNVVICSRQFNIYFNNNFLQIVASHF